MTLHIETEEVARVARELVGLTGESVDVAVLRALKERLERERSRARRSDDDLTQRLKAFHERRRHAYDMRPITPEEWEVAGGDGL